MLWAEVDSIVPDLAVLDRVLARLLNGARDTLRCAVGIAGMGKIVIDGDEPSAHGLGSSIFSKTCRREGPSCKLCGRTQAETLGAVASEPLQ